MVGFKTLWILLSTLFLLAACVPQTKQTECGANEAFNASLRTCVPVVGGPSSFINVSSFSPQFTQTRYKDDSTTLTFTIAVSNPYNQSYTVEWERVFNAGPVTMCSNALTCSFSASLLGNVYGEVGTHILTAKIKDGTGAVVDSHSFELKINDLPKPVINTATLNPASYAFEAYPTDPRIPFSFTIKNNNATISASDNYRTVWTIVKNGATLLTENDVFTQFTPNGTNNAYLGVTPTPAFNPATLGVGSYIVRAVVQNDVPGEVVAEQQWNVVIKQPDLANVTIIGSPAPGVVTTAHNNVAYNAFPTLSWIAPTTQPNFCVTIDDRDGTYPSDGKSIQVRFYKDSLGGDICTKKTLDTPGTQTICLIDSNNCDPDGVNLPFDTSILSFSNANNTSAQTHKVTARLFDEATSFEFQRSDVIPSNGSYPIEWIVNNKPDNTAPNMGFGTINPTGCASAGAYTRSNCMVDQGTNFTVSFTAADDFFGAGANPEEFQWDVKLKYNGGDLTTSDVTKNTSCSKAFGTATTLPAASTSGYGTTQWTCTLAVPHHTSTGPLNPSVGSYQVVATMQDQGSPVGGGPLVSNSLSWNLVVKETNPYGITVAPQSILLADSHISRVPNANPTNILDSTDPSNYATENDIVTFRLNVRDDEVDNFQYRISLCTDNTLACTSSSAITSPSFVSLLRSSQSPADMNPLLFTGLLYQLPEDLLISRHTASIDIDTLTNRVVYFKVDVVDVPSVLITPVGSNSQVFSLNVRNYNPAPVVNTAGANPLVGSTKIVYSGYPFTIDPGSVSDASVSAAEKNLQYQWYAKIGAGAFAPITGSTSRILRYTPGNGTANIDLRLCVGDGTAANTTALTGACYGNWTVTPKKYLENLTTPAARTSGGELAVWYDDTNTVPNTQVIYSAFVDDALNIRVDKTIKNAAGNVVISTNSISMTALASGTASSVSNLSISGSANSVYVAYIASASVAPTTMVPRVRRIDKSFDLAVPARTKAALDHPAGFGFNYAHYSITPTCVPVGNCVVGLSNGLGSAATITFAAPLANGDTIEINGVTFEAVGAPAADDEICDSTSCASANSTAINLRDKINNSPDLALRGITASATAGVLSLFGQYNADYLDFDGTIAGVPGLVAGTNGLGKIMVNSGRWNLPMINTNLVGPDQNNITVVSGLTDVHLRGAIALSTNNDLLEMGKVAAFDAKINAGGELVIARISGDLTDAGRVAIFRYSYSAPVWQIFNEASTPSTTDRNRQDLFGSYSFEYVKLATDATSNPYYYVIAREKTVDGSEYHMGRYNNILDVAQPFSENFLTAKVETADSTDDVITDAKLKFPDVISIPGFAEARIFFHSVGAGATEFPRLARWKADDMIACGTCSSLSGDLEYLPTAKIGISQIANNVVLGEIGNVAGENQKDLVFALFSSDLGNNDIFKPQLAIINVEAGAVQATTVDATGMWRPPFVLD